MFWPHEAVSHLQLVLVIVHLTQVTPPNPLSVNGLML